MRADGLGLHAEGVADKVDGGFIIVGVVDVWAVWGASVRGLFTLGDRGRYLLSQA